ncbi:MAG: sulfotransferase family protein [Actinomycetota bacterium]
MRPLFLLSLPRSGSTLLQRILGAHGSVATSPEPWLLLPQVYALREYGAFAEYGQVPSSRAIREFAGRLPGGETAYLEAVRAFAMDLYGRATDATDATDATAGVEYFLDKTPRYHFIADELFRIFPDARTVFLWRNPLSVVASIVDTWSGGRWKLERWHDDLHEGPPNLVNAFRGHRDGSFGLRFEDLVASPDRVLPDLFAFLGLEFDPQLLEGFASVRWDARMGDPTGTERYEGLSTEPLDKWKATIRGPVRTRWARSYLTSLGSPVLAEMGYDLDELLGEVDSQPGGLGSVPGDTAASISAAARRSGRRAAARFLWSGPRT